MNRYVITREQINGQEYQVSALYDEAKHMVEVSLAKEGCASLLGNIYIGRVEHVLGNLNAAFVKISPEQRCYLSLDDLKAPVFTRKLSKKKALAEGEELLVQVTREAIKTKEPAVTADLSLSGTYAVVSTGNKKCGVSAKLPKERRKHFTELLGQTADGRYGIVVRTNAGNASDEAVLAEIADLQRQCDGLLAAAKHKDCFGLLYEKPPLFLRELDNLRTDSLEQIVTDDRQVFEQVCAHYHIPQEALVTKGCVPAPVDTAAAGEQLQIRFYRDDAVSLSTLYSVKSHLKDALRERVWLKSGASADGGSDRHRCEHRKKCGKTGCAGAFSARKQGGRRGDCKTAASAQPLWHHHRGFYQSDRPERTGCAFVPVPCSVKA